MWFAEIEHFKGGKRTEAKSSYCTSVALPVPPSLSPLFWALSFEYVQFNVCVCVCESLCVDE